MGSGQFASSGTELGARPRLMAITGFPGLGPLTSHSWRRRQDWKGQGAVPWTQEQGECGQALFSLPSGARGCRGCGSHTSPAVR